MTDCKKCIYFGTSDCKAENCPSEEITEKEMESLR